MDPIKIEYVHLKQYEGTLKDPKQKKKFFETDANTAEDVMKIHEALSVQKQVKQNQSNNFTSVFQSKTFEHGQEFIGDPETGPLKTKKDFQKEFNIKMHHSGLLVRLYDMIQSLILSA